MGEWSNDGVTAGGWLLRADNPDMVASVDRFAIELIVGGGRVYAG